MNDRILRFKKPVRNIDDVIQKKRINVKNSGSSYI